MTRSVVLGTSLAILVSLIFYIPSLVRGIDNADRVATSVIPIIDAEALSTSEWSPEKRQEFLNDPNNLWPLSNQDRRERRKVGLLEWRPPTAQCKYLSRVVSVIETYELNVSPQQFAELLARRQQCYTQFQ